MKPVKKKRKIKVKSKKREKIREKKIQNEPNESTRGVELRVEFRKVKRNLKSQHKHSPFSSSFFSFDSFLTLQIKKIIERTITIIFVPILEMYRGEGRRREKGVTKDPKLTQK